MTKKNLEMPTGLDLAGKRAYDVIRKHLNNFKDIDAGGCTSFYSPKEWTDRKEDCGRNSKLIIVYDGSELRAHFNMDTAYDRRDYSAVESMQAALRSEGLYVEECTGWYGAVYED